MAKSKITHPRLGVSRFGYQIELLIRALGVNREEAESRFEALCRRLEVTGPAPGLWAEVTTRLILEQPEIRGNKRGRRRLSRYESGVDYKRALAVNARRGEKQADGKHGRITDKELVAELFDEKHPLFRNIDDAAKSVSRGQTRYKHELAETKRILMEAAAEKKRQDARARRQRRSHEASMRKTAVTTGNLFLDALSASLVKPRKPSNNRD